MFGKLLLAGIGVGLVVSSVFAPHPEKRPLSVMLYPPQQLKNFSFGYQENLSDALWLRVIQDMDTCGKKEDMRAATTVANPKSLDDLLTSGQTRVGRCEMSWVFHMIDLITDLSPRFRQPYSSGSIILSVAVDDISGATKIFDKAILQFPNDWPLHYNAAYHYLYEVGDPGRAAELLVKAGHLGAPSWVFSLAARLYTKEGQALLAKSVLEDVIAENEDQPFIERLKERLVEIDRQLVGTKQ